MQQLQQPAERAARWMLSLLLSRRAPLPAAALSGLPCAACAASGALPPLPSACCCPGAPPLSRHRSASPFHPLAPPSPSPSCAPASSLPPSQRLAAGRPCCASEHVRPPPRLLRRGLPHTLSPGRARRCTPPSRRVGHASPSSSVRQLRLTAALRCLHPVGAAASRVRGAQQPGGRAEQRLADAAARRQPGAAAARCRGRGRPGRA